MNTNPFELAREQAAILEEHLAPVEQKLRESMVGAYALAGVNFDALQQNSERELRYASFAAEVITLLPHAQIGEWAPNYYEKKRRILEFQSTNEKQPQNLFRSVVWDYVGERPFYVLGMAPAKIRWGKVKEYSAISMAATNEDGNVHIYKPGVIYRGMVTADSAEKRNTVVTPEKLSELYKKSMNKFVVSGHSADSSIIHSDNSYTNTAPDRITDEEMVKYNVFGNLAELAIRFNVLEEYKGLLAKYAYASEAKEQPPLDVVKITPYTVDKK